jgi:hypothetical protein
MNSKALYDTVIYWSEQAQNLCRLRLELYFSTVLLSRPAVKTRYVRPTHYVSAGIAKCTRHSELHNKQRRVDDIPGLLSSELGGILEVIAWVSLADVAAAVDSCRGDLIVPDELLCKRCTDCQLQE